MTKQYLITLILIALPIYAYCQDTSGHFINGTIINNSNNERLEFVNIGIIKKNFGTISNAHGYFEIFIPDSLVEDTLTFSYIGFERLKVPITVLIAKPKQNIQMFPKEILIDDINIYANKPITKKYGTKGHSPLVFVPAYVDRDIYEIAFLVKSKKYPAKAKYLNIYIKSSSIDSCRFRINFYDNQEGIPNNILNTQNIIIKKNIVKNDWNKIDLTDYNLVISKDFFVSVEFIPDFESNEAYQISYGGKLIKEGKTYFRSSSLGDWVNIPYNISFNIDLLY